MSWWGKIIGGALGFALGGPIGALMGMVVGHLFDRGLQAVMNAGGTFSPAHDQERVQTVFFTTVFSVMGHVAKIDGHISQDEVAMARNIMQQMRLDEQQQRLAIELFQKGKQADFPIDTVLHQFRQECGRRRNLMQMFIEILLHAVYADGQMKLEEKRLLHHICKTLGFSPVEFTTLENMIRAQQAFHGDTGHTHQQSHHHAHSSSKPRPDLLHEAYQMLGVATTATDSEVKKAYRRLMNQHHPDKLVAKGLPQAMVKIATEKTQEIKAAYDTICQARGVK